ncbi:hypothetical protein EG328_003292 [Venturia inaequalis]|uniref:Aquaporin-like protein n=1 Tax=Venturia inaequalis TaxID=5025 RepID=A0A8H3YZF6_VENIN|nr:hypothetical protein EG328_003292 [Venturia inaequalis]RDI78797.1 hypothetical protein Vi05172_g11195 [Venturia inaequalis]
MDSLPHHPEAAAAAGYPRPPSSLSRRKSSRSTPLKQIKTSDGTFHDVGSPSTIRNHYPAPYYHHSYDSGIIGEDVEPSKGKGLRGHFVAATGEFVGTFMFLWFAFAGQLMVTEQASDTALNGSKSAQSVVFICLIYGLSLLVNAWAFYRISGGLFNPAVTLGLCLSGNLPYIRGLILVPFQLFGAMSAAGAVSALFPGPINAVQTTLSPHTSKLQGLIIEMFLTSLLVFMILMLAAEKTKVTFLAPLGIGLSLFTALLAGGFYTGGSLNPARTLGPAVAAGKFTEEHWVYWLGPCLGACLAVGYYRLIKALRYEEANPDQDSSGGSFLEK